MKPRRWWAKLAHRALLSQYTAFLAVGKSNQEFYLQNGVEANRIFFSPHFVDNVRIQKQFELVVDSKKEIRKRWNIPRDCVCFLYVGKLIAKKRLLDLLEALEIACRTPLRIHLLVVGTGVLMDDAQHVVEERSLPVSFAGFLNQTEITNAYAVCDCLVLPSDYGETWGLVVNEAMVCGLPAIVSDRVGCGPDLVEDGVTGAVFPFGDIKALAERLVQFASQPEKIKQMGQHAKQRVKLYCVEKAVEGTMLAINAVLGKAVEKNSTQ